jgi:hypothetical protein
MLKKIIANYFKDRKEKNTPCSKMVYIFSKAGGKNKNHCIIAVVYNK